jgi:penicillin-binding protein 1B
VFVALAFGVFVSLLFLRDRVLALRDFRRSGPGWSFPSRVYSDWLELDARLGWPRDYLRASLAARGYQQRDGAHAVGTYDVSPHRIDVRLRPFVFPDGPSPATRARLYFENGRLSRVAVAPGGTRRPRIEPLLLTILAPEDRLERTFVPLSEIPPVVQAAILAAEDRRFYSHTGFDTRGTARALVSNLSGRSGLQGGSTITQQLARTLFLSRRRTIARKLQETAIAVGLEILLSKEAILEMYLNSVYLGHVGRTDVAGVAEGARHYFDKRVGDLTLPEAALLAGIVPAPNSYSPFRDARQARRRRDEVLADMVESGRLDAEQARRAAALPLAVRRGADTPSRFPFYTDHVRAELGRELSAEAIEGRGLRVFTALDPVWQARAEIALAAGVADVERWYGRRREEPLEGAVCVLESGSGRARALVGGRNYRRSPFNRATQSLRQPGSAFKPVVYAAAFAENLGDPSFTAATTVPDLPREFFTPEGPWRPRNDDGSYRERVTIAKALAKSLNVATANLTERVGPRTVARYAIKLGVRNARPVLSIGLGTNEISLFDLSGVYATLQANGRRIRPHAVRFVTSPLGETVYEEASDDERALPARAAELTVHCLRNVVDFGTAYPLKRRYGFTRPAAGKTGTTDEYRDAWFVGFTPEMLCGVWLGYDTPAPLGHTAADTALPVWERVASSILQEFPVSAWPVSEWVEFALIDAYSGDLATPLCTSVIRAPFVRSTAPARACQVDHSAEWIAEPDSLSLPDDTFGPQIPAVEELPPDSSAAQ